MTDRHPIDGHLAALGIDPDTLEPAVLDALRAATPNGPPVRHLDRNHPVRYLLTEASFGRQPTTADLDQLDASSAGLPDGQSLARFRSAVKAAATEVAEIAAAGNHAEARRIADDRAATIAARMSDDEAALTSTGPADPEPLDDVAARMFGPY
jgi:hypothetical protein